MTETKCRAYLCNETTVMLYNDHYYCLSHIAKLMKVEAPTQTERPLVIEVESEPEVCLNCSA